MYIVKAMVFPVWMWELHQKEGWAPKNWCFWSMVLKKTLGRALDSKEIKTVDPKGNQHWIFIGGLMLKLKLQYFSYLIRRADSLEKTLMLGKTDSRRRRGQQWMRCLDGITNLTEMSLSKLQETVKDRKVHRVTKSQTQSSNQTTNMCQTPIKALYLITSFNLANNHML